MSRFIFIFFITMGLRASFHTPRLISRNPHVNPKGGIGELPLRVKLLLLQHILVSRD